MFRQPSRCSIVRLLFYSLFFVLCVRYPNLFQVLFVIVFLDLQVSTTLRNRGGGGGSSGGIDSGGDGGSCGGS